MAFYTGVASGAERAVSFMIVLRAEGPVVEDVEVDCLEGRVAFETDETAAVVSTGETAVG